MHHSDDRVTKSKTNLLCKTFLHLHQNTECAFKKESHKDLKKHEAKCLNNIYLIKKYIYIYLLLEKIYLLH